MFLGGVIQSCLGALFSLLGFLRFLGM